MIYSLLGFFCLYFDTAAVFRNKVTSRLKITGEFTGQTADPFTGIKPLSKETKDVRKKAESWNLSLLSGKDLKEVPTVQSLFVYVSNELS